MQKFGGKQGEKWAIRKKIIEKIDSKQELVKPWVHNIERETVF